jgi:hypothetical protein
MVEMAAREPTHDPDSSHPGSPAAEPVFPALVDAEVHSRWPLGAAAQVLLLGHLREVLARRGPVAAGGEEIEHLHKLRVACRRLRSALHGTSELWPRKTSRAALRAVKDLARGCSRARDLDVEAEHLSTLVTDAPHDEELALRWLWARARQARHDEQTRVRDAVRRFDEGGWPEKLVTLFSTTPVDLASWTPPAPKGPKTGRGPRSGPAADGDDRGDDDQTRQGTKAKKAKADRPSGRAGKGKASKPHAAESGTDNGSSRNKPQRRRAAERKLRPSRNKALQAGAEAGAEDKPPLPLPPSRKRVR